MNVIFFQDNKWNYKDTGNVLARTTAKWAPNTATITDADMEINSAQAAYTLDVQKEPAGSNVNGFELHDLQGIVVHELGHFLGLAHSQNPKATMFTYTNPGQRTLSDDDITGICTIYPPNSPEYCNPEPINGFSGDCEDSPGGDSSVTTSWCAAATSTRPGSSWPLLGGAGLLLAGAAWRRRSAGRLRKT